MSDSAQVALGRGKTPRLPLTACRSELSWLWQGLGVSRPRLWAPRAPGSTLVLQSQRSDLRTRLAGLGDGVL